MFYSIWLLAAALAGWAGGTIAGDDRFGTGADILLGITGAFVVRWSLENIGAIHQVWHGAYVGIEQFSGEGCSESVP
jgi:uncharacterized membrane protein YeaQ/YmgE (transglycosylase-associated protein family)